MNISQIAMHLGYTNTAYFSRLFKQRFEMTPSDYCHSFSGD